MMRVPVRVAVHVCDDEESSRVPYRTLTHDTCTTGTVRLLLSTFTHEM